MVGKIKRLLYTTLALLVIFVLIITSIGIFFAPIYLMYLFGWLAGFLFLVSWIPSVGILAILAGILTLLIE